MRLKQTSKINVVQISIYKKNRTLVEHVERFRVCVRELVWFANVPENLAISFPKPTIAVCVSYPHRLMFPLHELLSQTRKANFHSSRLPILSDNAMEQWAQCANQSESTSYMCLYRLCSGFSLSVFWRIHTEGKCGTFGGDQTLLPKKKKKRKDIEDESALPVNYQRRLLDSRIPLHFGRLIDTHALFDSQPIGRINIPIILFIIIIITTT